MAPTTSKKSIRVRGLDMQQASLSTLEDAIKAPPVSSRRSLIRSFGSPATPSEIAAPIMTLAGQNEFNTSTISFATPAAKLEALKLLAKNYEVDDQFDGLTILSAPQSLVDVDVCAVHGLGGNAFDTWMGNSHMWLRDFLSKSKAFEQSRTMMYGYDSTLVNRKSNDRIRDWADELLRQLGYVRTTEEEQARPIILVCHSLGGLVAREAMWRLHTQAAKFEGVRLDRFGLIFLSTPHSGSTAADWSQYLVGLSELTFGVRSHEIVDQLRSFNPASVDSAENFVSMDPVPPFHCFCEGDKTSVAGRNCDIVTQASAGFCGQVAEKILKVDHHNVCKFDTQFGGYMAVLAALSSVKRQLLGRIAGFPLQQDARTSSGTAYSQNIPGGLRIVAPHYPLNKDTKWYEGTHLRSQSQMVGRVDTIEKIMKSLQQRDTTQLPRLISLTGIGGIGKTEILLETAFRFRNMTNIFFIRAHDQASLDQALLEIARSIGHDLLSIRFPHSDLAAIWRSYGPSERIQAFKTWLGHPNNQPNLFIVDDLDGLEDENLIKAALPREAQAILYSTRDPSLIGSLERDSTNFQIPGMQIDEMASLMNAILKRSGSIISDETISESELEAVARVVDGHALGACRAMAYILNVLAQTTEDSPASTFLDIYNGPDWEARLQFLNYKPRIGLSIMETFAISLNRMHRRKEPASRLLELLAFLSSKDSSLNFRTFLGSKRPWLKDIQTDLPDYDLFATKLMGLNEYLAELENVSLGMRPNIKSPLRIHPLWLECIQQRVGHEGRLRWIRQILLICYGSRVHDTKSTFETLQPFIDNLLWIAARFDIALDEICASEKQRDWINSLQECDEDSIDPFTDPSNAVDIAQNTTDLVDTIPSALAEATMSDPLDQYIQKMTQLRDECQETSQLFASLNFSKMSDEAFTPYLRRYQGLLRNLQKFEESNEPGLESSKLLHLEIYDILIAMAPALQHLNPMLGDQLRKRREIVV